MSLSHSAVDWSVIVAFPGHIHLLFVISYQMLQKLGSIYELRYSKMDKLACAPIEDSDQTAQSDQGLQCV